MQKSLLVGLFDSGVGGLNIASRINSIASCSIYYFADHSFLPYGSKSSNFIKQRSLKIAKFLINSIGIDVLVIACNTATALSIDYLRKKLNIPIIGVEPYINIINKYKLLNNTTNKIVLLTTPSLAKSKRLLKLKKRLDLNNRIKIKTCPNMAKFIEDYYFRKINLKELTKKLKKELKNVKATHVILGCTHYSFIKKEIKKVLKCKIISADHRIAQHFLNIFKLPKSKKNSINQVYFRTTNSNWIKCDPNFLNRRRIWPKKLLSQISL